MELISRVKQLTDKPILAKGIHSQDSEIVEAIQRGAEYVLVV
jgi:indole-3-glycerol phosphate synthase